MYGSKNYSLSEAVKQEVLRQPFGPTVPHNVLTPTAVKFLRIEAQAQNDRDISNIVIGLIAEDDPIVVLKLRKRLV